MEEKYNARKLSEPKGDVLVDDSPANIESVARYGIAGVLMPRPWNGKNGEITDALDKLTAIVDALG